MEEPAIHPFEPRDAPWVVARHAALYAAEEGFDSSFGSLVGDIVDRFVVTACPGRDAGWIAWFRGRRVGSVFVVADAPGIARLRLFLLEPDLRGTGLAQRLLDTATGFAREAGYGTLRLWTHESHVAAGRVYARNGFALVGAEPGQAFGQDVVSQTWERAL